MKKTLTTLSVAALLAAGGIAVAQTVGTDSSAPSSDMSSSATVSNSASADMGSTAGSSTMGSADTSTLGAGSSDTATLGSDTGTLDANSPVAQADRG